MSLPLQEAEALDTETKLFEDLEFQQLERESRLEEERELAGQGLLRSKAELLRSVAKRKVCVLGAGILGDPPDSCSSLYLCLCPVSESPSPTVRWELARMTWWVSLM